MSYNLIQLKSFGIEFKAKLLFFAQVLLVFENLCNKQCSSFQSWKKNACIEFTLSRCYSTCFLQFSRQRVFSWSSHLPPDYRPTPVEIWKEKMVHANRTPPSVTTQFIHIFSCQCKHFVAENFIIGILLLPWDAIEQIADPRRLWELWKKSLLAVTDLHAPFEKRGVETPRLPGSPLQLNGWCGREIEHTESQLSLTRLSWNGWSLVNYSIEACKKDYYQSYFVDNVGRAKET